MDVETMKENAQDLKDIVNAVVDGDGKKARELAIKHVYRFNTYMQSVLEKNEGPRDP
jgi:DNA-binding FadR family transcriptional regulator